MATSGSYDWTQTRNQIIKHAYRKIGAIPIGTEPSGNQVSEAAEALNMLVQNLQASESVYLWSVAEQSSSLGSGISYIDLDVSVIGVEKVWIRDANNKDWPVELISKFDYADIRDKTLTGRPTAMWFERKLGACRLHFDRVTDIATYYIHYFQVKRLADFDSSTDTGDFPERWILPLVFLLATIIGSGRVPIPELDRLERIGTMLLRGAKKGNREQTDGDFVEGCF